MNGPDADLVLAGATAVAVAVMAFLLLTRWGVWRWLTTVAAMLTLLLLLPTLLTRPTEPAALVPVLLTSAGVLVLGWQARPTAAPATVALALVALALVLTAVVGPGTGTGPAPGSGTGLDPVAVVGVLLAGLLVLAASTGLARARHSGLRLVCATTLALPVAAAAATVLLSAAPRGGAYGPAVLAWAPAATALALTALTRGRRSRAASRPQQDEVDLAATAAFDRRYDTPRLASVVVVIAAYNEEGGIREVLRNLPESVCDLPVDVLVVDDGSADATTNEVDEAGRGYLVACAQNRGQGAALRLGYRVARTHGARYVITTDGDGQYDATDLPIVLAPLLRGEADFVTGSRLLGQQHTRDRVRRLGVHVFAWLVSALVGRRLTDTSFGLRAMRSEVTATVTLNQPQYQSSELLIGAVSHGFRVLEVPGTMRVRGAGASKKGGNLVYGCSYARVVVTTWWREGCPAPVAERAPALRGSGATAAR